jgi:hypothetical protein
VIPITESGDSSHTSLGTGLLEPQVGRQVRRMALFVEGMECMLCGKPMDRSAGQEVVMFRRLASNHLDPLWPMSDGAFHAECFRRHPLAGRVERRIRELEEHASPWPPLCTVCGTRITHPADFFGFGPLTDDPEDPLAAYNYRYLHASCLREWSEASRARELLEQLQASGRWGGPALLNLLAEMARAMSASPNGSD